MTVAAITTLLERVGAGDAQARDVLYQRLYPELRRLARARLSRSETITLLDTTALVHESYLRFLRAGELAFEDRARFFAYVASVMRSVVIDEVRKRRADCRGGAAVHVELDEQVANRVAVDDTQLMRVHEALDELAAFDERLARVVEMRYFTGLSEQAIADALGVTERTVRRDWEKARALLYTALH